MSSRCHANELAQLSRDKEDPLRNVGHYQRSWVMDSKTLTPFPNALTTVAAMWEEIVVRRPYEIYAEQDPKDRGKRSLVPQK
jgi:hypothetical protein